MRYFDLHCDTLTACNETGQSVKRNDLQLSLERGGCFEKWRQCFAVWFPDGESDEKWTADFEICFELFKSASEGSIFTLENAQIAGLDGYSPEILKKTYGIGMLSLTWNAPGRLCGGCSCSDGLTPSGRQVVKRCEESGIALDMSHISDEGFYDVIKCTDMPIAASHSNCRELCPAARNLTDSQIKLIIERNGIIGLCYYPRFLGFGNVFERIYENIVHILSLGGENALAFGSDFDGANMDESLNRIDKVPDLYKYLEAKGLEKQLLDMIFYQNAEKFFKRFYI